MQDAARDRHKLVGRSDEMEYTSLIRSIVKFAVEGGGDAEVVEGCVWAGRLFRLSRLLYCTGAVGTLIGLHVRSSISDLACKQRKGLALDALAPSAGVYILHHSSHSPL